MESLLQRYRRKFSEFVLGWDGEGSGTYYEDWTDYLSDDPFEGQHGDDQQARHEEFNGDMQTAARIKRAALLATEHTRLMAWLAEKGKQGLYGEFEGVLREEHGNGEYPGVPVRDLPRTY